MNPDTTTYPDEALAPRQGEAVGLLGGTFDPVHVGHLRAALEVKEALDLTRIYLVPAARPPHKTAGTLSPAADRLEMARRAVALTAHLHICDLELRRSGPSYTIDTIAAFDAVHPEVDHRYLILGLDAFLEIETWYRFKALFKIIPMAVLYRPGNPQQQRAEFNGQIDDHLRRFVSDGYRFSPERTRFEHPELRPVYPLAVPYLEISATRIRRQVRNGRSIRHLVPTTVETYIEQKGLYH